MKHLAGSLTALGVEKGDRVIVYMPMIGQTVMAMLACARIGAVHSVVFGGFAAKGSFVQQFGMCASIFDLFSLSHWQN